MAVFKIAGYMPQIDEVAFVADSASVMGNVLLKKGGSIWFNATVRADLDKIVIGEHSNIQDNCVLHLDVDMPVIVGDYVTVGHGCILHACKIGDKALIGMGATLLDNVEVGEGSIIAAGSVVAPNTKIPPYSMVMGIPGKIVKQLDPKTEEDRVHHALEYEKLWKELYKNKA
jgi:carbonic anhydrase/acetyltransferase-like protein (isoleucine patch superfamily)